MSPNLQQLHLQTVDILILFRLMTTTFDPCQELVYLNRVSVGQYNAQLKMSLFEKVSEWVGAVRVFNAI